ncbi:MAG TPA: hypothetical protein VF897_13150 [Roseiflexaceae bacterium]
MLTYENFVAVLLTAIEQTDLNIAYTQELLDTHALGRSLSITCLPHGVEDDRAPEEPPLRAVIAFRWSPEFTVFSLRGGPPDGFDGIVDERILASSAGVGIEIDVTYTLPITEDPITDLSSLPQIARAVQELYASVAPDAENPIRVDLALAFPQGLALRVRSLTIHQTWPIGDALFDSDLLADIFEELCGELRDILDALAEVYLPEPREGQAAVQESEDLTMERRYLKPPTA